MDRVLQRLLEINKQRTHDQMMHGVGGVGIVIQILI